MIKLILRFALLAAAAALFAWLADNPGSLTLVWKGKQITTSVVAGFALLLVVMAALAFLWSLWWRLWRSPRTLGGFLKDRRNRKAYESLSRGIIAAGAGDSAAAARHAAVAAKGLRNEPLVNVLAAQAAQLAGDRAGVKRIFEAMAKEPSTQALGLRGLFAEARQAGDIAAARRHAEQALRLNPRLAWASDAVLQLQSLSKDWSGAAATLAQRAKSALIAAPEANRKQAVMLAAQALALEDREPTQALDLATRALKREAGLVPAALVAARRHIANAAPRKAVKILREAWARNPHPDLAELYARHKPGDGPEARFEKLRDLTGNDPAHLEGAFALARGAAAAQRWDAARKLLEPYVVDRPEARLCALMAEIEEAAGDKGRAREWLARAIVAPRDPMWVNDGVASTRWSPVSPVSGEIAGSEWKRPFETPPEAERPLPPLPVPAIVSATPAAERLAAPVAAATGYRPPDDPGIADSGGKLEPLSSRPAIGDG